MCIKLEVWKCFGMRLGLIKFVDVGSNVNVGCSLTVIIGQVLSHIGINEKLDK